MPRRCSIACLTVFLVAAAAAAQPAVLVELSSQRLTWALRAPETWANGTELAVGETGWKVAIDTVGRYEMATSLVASSATRLRLGTTYQLDPTGAMAPTPPPTRPTDEQNLGVVIAARGDRLIVQTRTAPLLSASGTVHREGQPVARIAWSKPEPASDPTQFVGLVQPAAARPPRVGDAVSFRPAAQAASTLAIASGEPASRRPRPIAQETVIPGDDPVYDIMASLAAAGHLGPASARQFAGEIETVYTRRQLVDFLTVALTELSSTTERWPIQSMGPESARRWRWLVNQFRDELLDRGVPVGRVLALLDERGAPRQGFFATGLAETRLQTGFDQSLTGRVKVAGFGHLGDRHRFGLTVGSEGGSAHPPETDRHNLTSYFATWDISRHASLGLGRLPTRYGPGLYDLLWLDRAAPTDALFFRWRTNLFGRPFTLEQQTGYYRDGIDKYVTVRRFEYLPSRQWTVGMAFGLVTDHAMQAFGSMFVPLYAARFLAGEGRAGGEGNFLGEVDVTWRASPRLAFYGQLFADDFDFSSAGPTTANRLGWTGGIHYTPPAKLPGSSYRLEATIIPEPGTYTGQADPALTWQRRGFILGHPYGEDSFGVRFLGRQRLTHRFDVTLGLESFRQFRDDPIDQTTTRFDLSVGYDLRSWLAVSSGLRYQNRTNVGGIGDNDVVDQALFIQATARY